MANVQALDKAGAEFRIVDGKLKDRIIKVAYRKPDAASQRIKAEKINLEVFNVIDEHLSAFVNEGVKPPKAIAAAIENFADDYKARGDITMRAGDYLSIQNFIKEGAR